MALNVDTNFPPSGPAPYRIDPGWCIGDSLTIINNNSFNFDNRLESLDTRATAISAGVDTKVSKSGDTMTGALYIYNNLQVRDIVQVGGSSGSAIFVQDRNLNATQGAFYRSANINRLWDQAAGDVITYNSSGNVGIGTVSPTYRLTIAGNNQVVGFDNTAVITAKNAAGNYENVFFPRWSDNVTYLNYGSGGLHIRNNADASVLFAQNGGNVGIGTTNPTSNLQVSRTTAGNPTIIKVENVSSATATTARFDMATGTANAYSILSQEESNTIGPFGQLAHGAGNIGGMWFTSGTTSAPIVFRQSSTERMRINSAGNVGIGTTNPQQALHVQGNVRVGDATLTQPSGSAPMFVCRAWVNFDATRNAAGGTDSAATNRFIRASGNVSSVLQVAAGDYRITFTTPMPTANYCVTGVGAFASAVGSIGINTAEAPTTTTVRIRHGHFAGSGATGFPSSPTYGNVAIFA